MTHLDIGLSPPTPLSPSEVQLSCDFRTPSTVSSNSLTRYQHNNNKISTSSISAPLTAFVYILVDPLFYLKDTASCFVTCIHKFHVFG